MRIAGVIALALACFVAGASLQRYYDAQRVRAAAARLRAVSPAERQGPPRECTTGWTAGGVCGFSITHADDGNRGDVSTGALTPGARSNQLRAN